MNVAQIQYADCYSDPLPAVDTLSRMGGLLNDYNYALRQVEKKQGVVNALNRLHLYGAPESVTRLNDELTCARQRVKAIKGQIVAVARLIVGEGVCG